MDPLPKSTNEYANANAPFRHSEWPAADQIGAAGRRLDAAEKAAHAAWASLSDDDKIGLHQPPSRK
jgi:hypothetical protein